MYLSHSIEFGSDSINNHVHVWWVADDLWHHGRLPWRFPLLGHGDAYVYPYGFVNWTTAALLWPLFGNWAVTLWTVVGSVGCIVATFIAFPELRRGYWAAAVLANPAILFRCCSRSSRLRGRRCCFSSASRCGGAVIGAGPRC